MEFKLFAGYKYTGMNEIDVSMFIKSVFKKCNLINDISNFQEVEIKLCGACNSKSIEQLNNNVLNLRLKNDGKTSHDFKELMNLQRSISKKYVECKNCNQRNEHAVQVDLETQKQNINSQNRVG